MDNNIERQLKSLFAKQLEAAKCELHVSISVFFTATITSSRHRIGSVVSYKSTEAESVIVRDLADKLAPLLSRHTGEAVAISEAPAPPKHSLRITLPPHTAEVSKNAGIVPKPISPSRIAPKPKQAINATTIIEAEVGLRRLTKLLNNDLVGERRVNEFLQRFVNVLADDRIQPEQIIPAYRNLRHSLTPGANNPIRDAITEQLMPLLKAFEKLVTAQDKPKDMNQKKLELIRPEVRRLIEETKKGAPPGLRGA